MCGHHEMARGGKRVGTGPGERSDARGVHGQGDEVAVGIGAENFGLDGTAVGKADLRSAGSEGVGIGQDDAISDDDAGAPTIAADGHSGRRSSGRRGGEGLIESDEGGVHGEQYSLVTSNMQVTSGGGTLAG